MKIDIRVIVTIIYILSVVYTIKKAGRENNYVGGIFLFIFIPIGALFYISFWLIYLLLTK